MSDVSEIINSTVDLFNNNLVVGNHDSITLFAIHPQNALKDYSKKVANLMIKQTEELDVAVTDVVQEIDYFEKRIKSTSKSFLGKNKNMKEIIREYHKIISYIESITLYFKLQQTQLIKEVKLFEKYLKNIEDYSNELMQYIDLGKEILNKKPAKIENRESLTITPNSSEEELWYYRLEKRIEDLSISHTLSLQSMAQIRMLHQNNLLMFDKISSAISNTFPIWQSQMTLSLGLEMLETRISMYNKSRKNVDTLDIDKIININNDLSTALSEMSKLEQKSDGIRKDFLKIQ